MYKIFAKDQCVFLIDNKTLFPEKPENKLVMYLNQQQLFKEYENFIDQKEFGCLYIYASDLKLLWNEYISLFQLIEAAGGIVKNNKEELLLIYRHQRWDLPKGKLEIGEEVEAAAIREVQEECGVQEIKITNALPVTYHTYILNDKHILKKTYWFKMDFTGLSDELKPQLEEDIIDVRWMNIDGVQDAMKNTYPLIKEALNSII